MKREIPGPGQESVWDYPRPPRLEESTSSIRVVVDKITIAESDRTFRMLEESHPPVFYIPPGDIRMEFMELVPHRTFCEWKGEAGYYDIVIDGRRKERAAWFYPTPSRLYPQISSCLAFYPSRVDSCYVDGEIVQAQEGDFYGGWITAKIVGPFKGGAGTRGW